MVNPLNSASPLAVTADELAGASASGASWPAIFAGAVAMVATSLILIELGVGLGLSSVSAWRDTGASLATIGVAGGVWLIVTQWIASSVGGYLAGRLRTKWVGVHTDEVFFRDTAHGLLAWSVSLIIGVLVLGAVAGSTLSAGGRAAGAVASGAGQMAGQAAGQMGRGSGMAGDPYFVDLLFRPGNPSGSSSAGGAPSGGNDANANGANGTQPNNGAAPAQNGTQPNGNMQNARGETARILTRDLVSGDLSQDDADYLTQLVAANTGLSQADAKKRVDSVAGQIKSAETQARAAAEKARKATAWASIIVALAMVVGAFIASVSGALGGRLRDEY